MIKFEYGQPGVMRLVKNHKLVEPRNCEEQYVAISHTWGRQWKDFPGVEWKVPTWISENILKELTKRFGNLWIYGLCIRQNDDRDVLLQIKKMGSYYRQAQKVIVLFNDDNWEKSLKALRESTQLLMKLKKLEENSEDFFDCFSNCEYANLLRELKANIEIARMV